MELLDVWARSCRVWIAIAACIFVILLFVKAPYGRHGHADVSPISRAFQVFVGDRWAWFLMELPSPLILTVLLVRGSTMDKVNPTTLFFFALWFAHYINRTVVYPWRLQGDADRPPSFHIATLLAGVVFNSVNATLNGVWLFELADAKLMYPWPEFLLRPRSAVGLLLFIAGAWINVDADERLRRLRQNKSSESTIASRYKIPRGGLFHYVSCANYFGELVEMNNEKVPKETTAVAGLLTAVRYSLISFGAWAFLRMCASVCSTQWVGYWLLTAHLGSLSFAIFTAANLIPRAIAHHKWYQEKFDDRYPQTRRAIIPFLL